MLNQTAGHRRSKPAYSGPRKLTAMIALLVCLPNACAAWSGEGHQVIAWIAEERLSAEAKAGVKFTCDGKCEGACDRARAGAMLGCWARHGYSSSSIRPEPPRDFGTSLSFGSPSAMRSRDSW